MLPKCEDRADLDRLSLYLDAFEAANGIEANKILILPIAGETAAGLFKLGSYAGCKRLWGITWGSEDLRASIGAVRNRTNGVLQSAYLLARDLCLAGAAAAGVAAIDTVYADIENLEGLRQETMTARLDGFVGKMLIHPKHVDIINSSFLPSEDEIAQARRIIAAFAENPSLGVARLDGKMIDKAHLRAAEKIVAMR